MIEVRRDRDCREDPDDQDNDEELDEREPAILAEPLDQVGEQGTVLWVVKPWVWSLPSSTAEGFIDRL